MRLYTHTGVLENRKKEKQKEVEKINVVENSCEENEKSKNRAKEVSSYVNNTIKAKINKKEKGRLRKGSCLFSVCIKASAIVLIMLILLIILTYIGAKQNWKIGNIEIANIKIGKVQIGEVVRNINDNAEKIFVKISSITGTKAEVEEVAAMDMTKVDLLPDKNGVQVPIPKGYVRWGTDSENDVNKGTIIFEGTEPVTDSNGTEAKLTRNQWIWVPVSAEKLSRVYSEDSYGRKFGKLYKYTSTGRTLITSEYPCEPKLLQSTYESQYSDMEYRFQYENLYGYNANKLYDEMQTYYEMTIESIRTYGGFYIGRYEMGNLHERKPVCVQYNTDIEAYGWWNMYASAKLLAGNENVKSMLIWGSLWDETLQWFIDSGARSYKTVGEDSTTWGNYENAEFGYYETGPNKGYKQKKAGSSRLLPTGAQTTTNSGRRNCTNYICDMAGNTVEYTMEADSVNMRNARGEDYSFTTPCNAAHRWWYYPTTIGGRAILIIV